MNSKLHLRITRLITIGAIGFAIVASSISYFYTHSVEQKSMEKALGQLFSTVKNTAEIAAYLDNEELALEVVESLIKNDLVADTLLKSHTGLWVTSIAPSIDFIQSLSFPLHDPFTPNEQVGEIFIQPNLDLLTKRVNNAALEQVAILVVHTLVIAILVLILVRRVLTHPIQLIATNLHDIVPGDEQNLACSKGNENDEIGNLIFDINKLLESTRKTLNQERLLRNRVESLEKHFRLIFERASAGIFLLNSNLYLTSVNQSFKKIAGIVLDEKRVDLAANAYLPDLFHEPETVHDLLQDVLKNRVQKACDLRLGKLVNGEERWLHCLFSTVENDNGETLIEGLVVDVTERTFQMEQILFESEHDPLTKLFNRRAGEQLLSIMLSNVKKNNDQLILLLIDLDKFKPINDNFGHEAGDKVLIEIANRMQATMRKEDVLMRFGGDEFIVAFASKGGNGDEAEFIMNKLQKQFDSGIRLSKDLTVFVGASIGMAAFPKNGNDIETLIAYADLAMYEKKKINQVCTDNNC